jgi:hypothetical protein
VLSEDPLLRWLHVWVPSPGLYCSQRDPGFVAELERQLQCIASCLQFRWCQAGYLAP